MIPYSESAVAGRLVDKIPSGGAVVSERKHPEIGVTEWKLSNGVRVLLKPTDFNADQVLLGAYSPGGASLLPDSTFIAASGADLIPALSGVGQFSLVDLQNFWRE